VTLVSACFDSGLFDAGGARLNFSEAVEVYGPVVAGQVTARFANLLKTGLSVTASGGVQVVVELDVGGLSIGASYVTLASGISSWLRSVGSRVPVTPVTGFTPFAAC
jgi:hypothetical protein